jgi:predicted GH43/DUF377 family glycosyl hydrolase
MIKILKDKLLLSKENIKSYSREFEVLGVLNPAAMRLHNGKILLYVRVIEKLKKTKDSKYFFSPRFAGKKDLRLKIDKFRKSSVEDHTDFDFTFKNGLKRLTYFSHLRRVVLDESGFRVLKIDKKPSFYGLSSDSELGVEDPRIIKMGEHYYMTYVGLTRNEGVSTNLAVSKDCLNWERKGIIFGEQDKDTVLFPEKINEEYVAFDRPEGGFQFTPPHMWVAYSKDLIHWGELKSIILPKKYSHFTRSGAGPPPIKIHQGWLLFFHAVTKFPAEKGLVADIKRFLGMRVRGENDIYSVWAALLDHKNPERLIAISHSPIIEPKRKEEISFEGKRVVFPTGLVMGKDGKEVILYSGAGDEFVTAKKIRLKDVLATLVKV